MAAAALALLAIIALAALPTALVVLAYLVEFVLKLSFWIVVIVGPFLFWGYLIL